MSEVFEDC